MQLNSRRHRDHGVGAHSPHDVILVTLDGPNHNTRPTNRIADARRYQASSIATRTHSNTDSARTSHSAALRMARDESLSLRDVQTILGHAHLSTTADVYLVEGEAQVISRVASHLADRSTRQAVPPLEPVSGGYKAADLAVLLGGTER